MDISRISQWFKSHDIDKNGQLDKVEIAKAGLNKLGQGQQEEGILFATFAQGGKDGQGLFPDFNNSGGLSADELQRFAAQSGDPNKFESSDFQKAFPDRFQAGGGNLDINRLQELAQQNLEKFKLDPNRPNDFANAGGSLLPNDTAANRFSELMRGVVMQFPDILKNLPGN